jgi:hypothetical protein
MPVRKILLAATAAALMTSPAWALPGVAPANQGKGHGPVGKGHGPNTTPNNTDNPGSSRRSSEGTANNGGKGRHGNRDVSRDSHKCKPHRVGYVASGTLVSQTLTKNADGTYSGEVTVEVKRTNHHAAGDKGTKPYKVEHVHVTFGLTDTNTDGSVGLDDLKAGDRVKLIGKITALAKKCDQSKFTATRTIRKLVFHAPVTPGS